MQNINADESLIREAEAIVAPVFEAGVSTGSESLLSVSADASYVGLAVAPATQALALAQ